MMKAVGLSPAEIAERHPEVMRSLKAGCALCAFAGRCSRSLNERTAAAEYDEFCLNAPVLKAVAGYERLVGKRLP